MTAERLVVAPASVLRLAPHAIFRFDDVRRRWIILAPERLLLPDEQAVEILQLLDGRTTVDGVVDALAARYTQAARELIAGDVVAMLQDLADKGCLADGIRVEPPLALLAELTHRCPLRCPYCSNPLELERAAGELTEAEWIRVLGEAATLGVLQVHFSGGEPMARRDLGALIAAASSHGLYGNLITSGTLGGARELEAFAAAGLKHVQLSFQDVEPEGNDRIAGLAGAHARKTRFAAAVRAAGLPLTINIVVHRHNLARLPAMIALAQGLGARRLEIAHVQYYAWALENRAALLPSRSQLDEATRIVELARTKLKGVLAIDYVTPDYHGIRPKACMNGWARRFLNIMPSGVAVPCHAAETLPGLVFPSVREHALADIWYSSEAFNRFRGTDWMAEPCRSCERREIDWGGCRCQAFLLAGDATRTDPVCALSPDHGLVEMALREAEAAPPAFVYRQFR